MCNELYRELIMQNYSTYIYHRFVILAVFLIFVLSILIPRMIYYLKRERIIEISNKEALRERCKKLYHRYTIISYVVFLLVIGAFCMLYVMWGYDISNLYIIVFTTAFCIPASISYYYKYLIGKLH